MQLTNSCALLAPKSYISQAVAIKEHMRHDTGNDISVITIEHVQSLSLLDIAIDDGLLLSPTLPAAVIFTSGTSGRPKAVVLPRRRFHPSPNGHSNGVIMAYRPPHWAGGLRSLTQPLVQGNTVYILPNRANAEVFWDYLRDIPFTQLSLSPGTLRQLKDYFRMNIAPLPREEADKYLRNIRNVKEITCSSAMIEATTLQFWKELLGNDIITNVYALTEALVVTKTRPGSTLKVSN